MAKTAKGTRSGFFFAVMALAMLSLVLMTVQVWVKTFEQSDYNSSQRFKGEAMMSVLASLSDQTLTDFANASAFYATYKLVDYTSNQGRELGVMAGNHETNNKGAGLVESTAIGLMVNGSSPPNWVPGIEYSPEEKNSYTLAGWQNKTDAAANAMGFDIQFSDAKNFNYYQIDPWTVGVSFDMEMNITDAEGTMHQSKTMHAESNFSISGFLDPMISRKDMEHRRVPRAGATEKQIFKQDAYDVPADVAPRIMRDTTSPGDGTGTEGNGWFFGPITEMYPNEISAKSSTDAVSGTTGVTIGNLKQYVLASPYKNGSVASVADSYGAVIMTEEPLLETKLDARGCNVTRQTRCLNCMEKTMASPGCTDTGWGTFLGNNPVNVPVIVATNWNTTDVTAVTRAQASGSITDYFVLIDNEKVNSADKMQGYHRIWDLTNLRDMAICGFYVRGSGPSFFQRMLTGAENIQNPEPGFGIESFVVGQWAGGAMDSDGGYAADSYSRLDWEFYKSTDTKDAMNAQKMKGMMGCKSKEMCTGPSDKSNATTVGLGRFRLSGEAAARYAAKLISCEATQSSSCN